MDNNIRIGRISSVDYAKGMVKIVYRDKDNSVTNDLPYINMNGEYKMPNIDDMVLALHLSNGSAMAIVIGTFWSGCNKPVESGKGIYRKEMGSIPGEAYIRYDSNSKVLSLMADTVQIITEKDIITY